MYTRYLSRPSSKTVQKRQFLEQIYGNFLPCLADLAIIDGRDIVPTLPRSMPTSDLLPPPAETSRTTLPTSKTLQKRQFSTKNDKFQ
jgi:hypothetical protein